MYKSYLLIAYRNLLRSKIFSLINIFGLAIGMAACFLILQYVRFELSYDKFHGHAGNIYRVTIDRIQGSDRVLMATNHPGIGPALKAEFPEVAEVARAVHQSIFASAVTTWAYVDDSRTEKVFNEEKMYDVDPSFLTMFSFPFVYGDPRNALSNENAVVISQTVARKFFGPENPMGKILLVNGSGPFTITGVFQDVPENSHIQFNMLVSSFMRGMDRLTDRSGLWKWPEFYTYIQLRSDASPEQLETKIPAFAQKYLGHRMMEMNFKEGFQLQPITDIHLKSPDLKKEREVHGQERTVYFLLIIAVLILVIAWINYINLSTSKSMDRAQEVGLRKVVGASKRQLIFQFLYESAMVNLLAMGVALTLVSLSLPYFNQLTGKNMGMSIVDLTLTNEPMFLLTLLATFILGSFLAGIYPAFVLSSFKIVNVLKGKFFGSKSGVFLRQALVASQFVISVALIAGTIMVFRQVTFMRSQDLGYSKEQLLVIKSPRVVDSTIHDRTTAFKTEVLRNTNVKSVAPSSEIPGKQVSMLTFVRNIRESREGEKFLCYNYTIDESFIDTYAIQLIAGRNFREDEHLVSEEKSNPVLVNQRTTELLGFAKPEDAINQLVYFGLGSGDWIGEIVGVVANHHQRSLKNDYDPIIFYSFPGYFGEYFTMGVNMQNPAETISFIEDQYEQSFPGNPFEYFFLDDYFDRQYAADRQFGKVFGLFSGLAVIVACLGLFGLTTFMISQRMKEIAVRKVLGATIASMVRLFSRDFVRLIIIANVVALPVVYFLVDKWLNTFAFHVGIGWVMFVVPAVVLLLISVATVSLQTIRTGSANPVKALRSE